MTDNLQAVRELPEYWRGRSATGESAPADELEAALAQAPAVRVDDVLLRVSDEDLLWCKDIVGALQESGGPTNNIRAVGLLRLVTALEAAIAQQLAACDMGALCIGCEPRNADGSCPGQQPAADSYCLTQENGECISTDPRCIHNKSAAVSGAESLSEWIHEVRQLDDNGDLISGPMNMVESCFAEGC